MAIRTLRTPTSYSVLLHALFFALMFISFQNQPLPSLPRQMQWVEIELPKETPAQDSDSRTQRMVETQHGVTTDTPPEDAFLGERSQTVDRQTVNRHKQTQSARGGSQRAQAPSRSAPSDSGKAAGKTAEKSKDLSHLGLAMLPPKVATERQDPAQEFARNRTSMDETQAALNEDETSLTSQAPQEYLKGFSEADQTQLNTKESVFFPYIQRIRERLDIAWERTLHERLKRYFNQGRVLEENQDLNTQVLVTLDRAGEVRRVQVIEGSGIRDLDSSAVDAFRIAGPFPNPPKGLLNTEGLVQIRWDLVVVS